MGNNAMRSVGETYQLVACLFNFADMLELIYSFDLKDDLGSERNPIRSIIS